MTTGFYTETYLDLRLEPREIRPGQQALEKEAFKFEMQELERKTKQLEWEYREEEKRRLEFARCPTCGCMGPSHGLCR